MPLIDLDLTAGPALVVRDDALLSPLTDRGALPALELGATVRGEAGTHRAAVGAAIGGLRTGPDWAFTWDGEDKVAGPSSVTAVDVRYAYGRRWGALSVGGTSANRIEAIDHAYAFTGTFAYLGAFDLGPWVELHAERGRHGFTVEAWTPLVSWIARSPYALNDDAFIWTNRDHSATKAFFGYVGDGGPAAPWQATGVHVRGSWDFAATERLHLLAAPRFDVWHIVEPLPVTEMQVGLEIGLRVRLG